MPSRLLVASALALSAIACGATEEPPIEETIEPRLSAIQQKVFIGCATSSCHSPTGRAGNLDLTAANAYQSLLGAEGTGHAPDNANAKSDGFVLVKPGDPSKSFLLKKVQQGLETSKYGALMPTVGDPLTEAKLKAISDWITAGAKND